LTSGLRSSAEQRQQAQRRLDQERELALGDRRKAEALVVGLHWAARSGDLEALKKNLDAGALPKGRHMEKTALMAACEGGAADALALLIPFGGLEARRVEDKMRPLMLAFEAGSVDCARLLVEAGALTGRRDAQGRGLCAMAAGSKSVEALDFALSLPFERADSRDHFKQTPLMHAARRNRGEAAARLAGLGTAGLVDALGRDALSIAAEHGSQAALEALLPWSDLSRKDHQGLTALAWAAQGAHAGCVELLLAARPGLALELDETGATALIIAAKARRELSSARAPQWMEALRALGRACDPLARDLSGRRAREWLQEHPSGWRHWREPTKKALEELARLEQRAELGAECAQGKSSRRPGL
jgi:ankyrin repeat protein